MFDLSYFYGKNHFVDDNWTQKYLVFQQVYNYFKTPRNKDTIMAWKSKGLLNESIKPPATSGDSLNSRPYYFNNPKFEVKFDESCFKSDKVIFIPNEIINLYITYEIKIMAIS